MRSIFKKNDLINGKILSIHKSDYKREYPNNEIYFNANIFVLGEGKVWYGDIDVTREKEKLETIAKEINQDLFILREMDGRFENEKLNDSEIISKAVCKISK